MEERLEYFSACSHYRFNQSRPTIPRVDEESLPCDTLDLAHALPTTRELRSKSNMNRKIWQTAQCQSCQYDVLAIFASLAGVTIRPAIRPRNVHSSITQKPCQILARSRRCFSAQAATRLDQERDASPAPLEEETLGPDIPASSSIPWYLQVAAPVPPAPSNALLDRQSIPTVPENAPPILSPILTYLSDTAGLDNLLLLDLRHLDPPSALGANLIMLIGTARSVKHLNVSADRFCRWCRSNYKLRPYADGLLGRNELKLKLRRKARRQKLAQSVGNTLEQNRDDGITTGWVCVNVGAVDEAILQEAALEDIEEELENLDAEEEEYDNPDPGYSGFGSRSTAPRIVVQMLTEEKRLETDLEGLWQARTSRRANKEEMAVAEEDMNSPKRNVWEQVRTRTRTRRGHMIDPTRQGATVDESETIRTTAI